MLISNGPTLGASVVQAFDPVSIENCCFSACAALTMMVSAAGIRCRKLLTSMPVDCYTRPVCCTVRRAGGSPDPAARGG